MDRSLKRQLTLRWLRPAFITPFRFSLRSGHWRSSWAGKALDRHGRPLPWYTYPAIDFLFSADFSSQSVFEFGAGQSTLWWAERAAQVSSVEDDASWFEAVKVMTRGHANVRLTLAQDPEQYAAATSGARFDLVVLDGGDRNRCAASAMMAVRDDGVVIFDNSNWNWGPPGTWPILDRFRDAGFMRVDFWGHAPGVVRPHCTSIFFKAGARLFSGARPPLARD